MFGTKTRVNVRSDRCTPLQIPLCLPGFGPRWPPKVSFWRILVYWIRIGRTSAVNVWDFRGIVIVRRAIHTLSLRGISFPSRNRAINTGGAHESWFTPLFICGVTRGTSVCKVTGQLSHRPNVRSHRGICYHRQNRDGGTRASGRARGTTEFLICPVVGFCICGWHCPWTQRHWALTFRKIVGKRGGPWLFLRGLRL